MQDILINIEAGERRIAVVRSKKLEWYFVERVTEKQIAGNIYKGKVNSVLNGIGAAFIDCGLEKNGFLYVSDITAPASEDEYSENGFSPSSGKPSHKEHSGVKISDILKKGQEIMVQVVKEELGTKGARLTTHISLPGRYLVLMPTSTRIGISRKIRNDDERRRIKTTLKELKLPKGMGFVARTAAEASTRRDLQKDVDYLKHTYERIKKLNKEKSAPSLLFEELDLSSRAIRDFLTQETAKVIIDDKQEFKRIRQFTARIAPQLKNKILLHKDHTPLFEKYGVEKEIDKLFERKIFLKCGGYITMEQTEGMVAIDVNSGRFTSKKNLEETVFKVNCEAAEEVARQLRLRDVGGIVVIDFIDMESREHRNRVFSILQNALKKDKAKTQIISLSELDIVEMTRQRIRRSLESVSYQNCPYCEGRGMVKSAATMSIVALRQLRKFLRQHKGRNVAVELSVHPYVAQRLVKEDAPALDILRRTFKRRISVVADDRLHTEEVKIAPPARH